MTRVVNVGLLVAALAVASSAPLLAQDIRIGTELGAEEYSFNWITDVRSTAGGVLYVLDSNYGLRWYTAEGRYGGRVGRTGSGPGELRNAQDIAVAADGQLHVLDIGNARISIFALRDGAAGHVRDHRLDVPRPVAICAAGNRRFVLSIASRYLVHEIDGDGRAIRSFGSPVQPDAELAREFRGQDPAPIIGAGPLVCDQGRNRLMTASGRLGQVRMYDLEGNLLWQVQLGGFVRGMMRYAAAMGSCCQLGPNPRTGTAQYVFAGAFDGNAVVVSIRTWQPGEATQYEIRRLRLDTGIELRREAFPMIVTEIDAAGRWIGYSREPFPHVRVLSRSRDNLSAAFTPRHNTICTSHTFESSFSTTSPQLQPSPSGCDECRSFFRSTR